MINIENLKKELLYRSWHRGCKETDILLGDYARAKLDKLSQAELMDYKEIVEQDDGDLYNWLCDKEQPPANLNLAIIKDIKKFHATKTV